LPLPILTNDSKRSFLFYTYRLFYIIYTFAPQTISA
jgi:hypothetical protein